MKMRVEKLDGERKRDMIRYALESDRQRKKTKREKGGRGEEERVRKILKEKEIVRKRRERKKSEKKESGRERKILKGK